MANKYYVIRDLRKQYAKLLGRHVAAERQVESAKGVKAIDAAVERVATERLDLSRQMDAIAETIRANYDSKWSPGGIKPIMPPVTGAHGELSVAVYKTLKEADGPLPIGAIVSRVGELLDLDLADGALAIRVRNGAVALLKAREKDGLVLKTGKPILWFRAPRPMIQPVASANTLPTPWR